MVRALVKAGILCASAAGAYQPAAPSSGSRTAVCAARSSTACAAASHEFTRASEAAVQQKVSSPLAPSHHMAQAQRGQARTHHLTQARQGQKQKRQQQQGAEGGLLQQQQQQQQQQQRARWPQEHIKVARAAFAVLTAASMLSAGAPAFAENELATLANSKSTAELVKPECFANSCKSQVEACANDGDCMKGLACTAKCMGDAQCTVGCFARYNDANLERVLQCTIEDAGCIAIATQAPGPDSAFDAPVAPHALIKASPASLQGRWYKVLGFNPNYDCFECQRNSFRAADGKPASGAKTVAMDVKASTAAVEVEYAMPRERLGMPTETFHATLNEKLEFDTVPGSRRTAHTEGKMFGLTFWENWYLIGENKPKEAEFKFVYYTGKTLQNRYEGAFVYARTPELPQNALPSIYKIARESGLDPTRACCIDNSCFNNAPVEAEAPNRPLFTPVAEAGTLEDAMTSTPSAPAAPAAPLGGSNVLRDIAELLEDPKPPAEKLFARQRPMYEVREYDANGYRVPTSGYQKQ